MGEIHRRRQDVTKRPETAVLWLGPALAAVLALTAVLSACSPGEPDGFRFPERPNVVLVVIDALRRDHLGAYGYERPTSPFLDTLAQEGILFEDAFAQSSVTFYSTASLWTSRSFPWLAENVHYRPVPGAGQPAQDRHALVPYLQEANLTLAEMLGEAGYDTFGAFTNPHHHPTSGFLQGFDQAEFLTSNVRDKPYGQGVEVHRKFFEWLEQRDSSAPYFALLYLMEVHNPYMPPRKMRQLFVEKKGRRLYVNGRPEIEPTEVDLAYMQALYDGEIRFMDGVMRALVEKLRERGDWDETLFVFTSDHGDEFMEHGGLGHGKTLFLEQLRIPMLMAGAGLAHHDFGERRFRGIVRNLDLVPTLAEAAGLAPSADLEGTSLMKAIREGTLSSASTSSLAHLGTLRSFTDERWHFVVDVTAPEKRWLFDRVTDPRGLSNVARREEGEVRRLSREIAKWERLRLESLRNAPRGKDDAGGEVDESVLRQLEALGYVSD